MPEHHVLAAPKPPLGGEGRVLAERMPGAGALLRRTRARLRTVVCLQALAVGLLLATAVRIAAWAVGGHGASIGVVAGGAGLALASAVVVRGWRRLTIIDVAAEIERRVGGLDNLLVSAVELSRRRRVVHPRIGAEIERQTEARVQAIEPSGLVPVARAVVVTAAVAVGASLAAWSVGGASIAERAVTTHTVGDAVTTPGHVTLTVVVTPPAYASLPATSVRDVAEVEVLEGSRVRIAIEPATADVLLVEAGQAPMAFERDGTERAVELVAERTRFLLLRFRGEEARADQLLMLRVKPDAAPVVRISQPARDLVFPEPRGRVAVEIEAIDDLALGTVSLRYTRVIGSGESTTFQEGDLPLRVERAERGRWRATSEISLEDLKLEDGDVLVYRATTSDLRPGRDPSTSDAYLLEVGRLAEAASAGFGLPDDKDRQALSQQMVIIKTERLHAERGRLSRDEFEEQARMLAVEQRMVRAEFIFMTGGDVQDEVAEAEHSHDLVEGRFENEGQVELLTAIREMSRAEARLNDAATDQALVSERAALAALQRAFDRRRYLLRTTPERARIDGTRRLIGELKEARSWRRAPATASDGREVERLETLARDLAAAGRAGMDLGPLAARLGAIDPDAPEVQQATLRLSAGASASAPERAAVIEDTLRLLADRARHALAPARTWVPHDPAAGRYADALAQRSAKP